MRKVLVVLICTVLLWLGFEVGREVGRLEEADSRPTTESVDDPTDTVVRELWRGSPPAREPTPPELDPGITGAIGEALAPTEDDPPESCGARCGVQRWQVKTLSDEDRDRVHLSPVDATIEDLGTIPRPAEIPFDRRVHPYETTVYRVRGYLAALSEQADGDLHLVLFDLVNQRVSLIAEIPDPECEGACRSGFAARFAAARQELLDGLERLAALGSDEPILLEVVGVGFFDHPHGQSGAAPNHFELHPVLALRFLR